jgi:hypothetical protein
MVTPRSWKDADAEAATREFLRKPPPRRAAIRELMKAILSLDPYTRRCAVDLARRVSAREPGIFSNYADLLIDLVAEIPFDEWQSRGYLTLAAALNATTRAQRIHFSALVRALLEDERIAIRAIALEAFAIRAIHEPELRDEAMLLLDAARHSKTPALRSRARRMLPQLAAAMKSSG